MRIFLVNTRSSRPVRRKATLPALFCRAGLPILLAALGVSVGCATSRPREIKPMTPRQVRSFARAGREPRAFFFSIRPEDEDRLVFVDAHRQVTDHTAILPFTTPGGSPVPILSVRASPDGHPFPALVDSTAAENWTSLDRLRGMNLTLIRMGETTIGTEPGHVEDSIPGLLAASPGLMFGTVRVDAVLFFARTASGPLWPLTRAPAAAGVDAVLGIPVLRSFAYVQWDFPGREMVFSATQAYEPDAEALLATLPVISYENGLEIIASLDGQEQRVVLDTAGEYAVAMASPPSPLLPQLRLENLVARQVRTVSSRTLPITRPEIPRIGAQWLSSYRITLDNYRQVIYIESP